jgi:carboxypeptidase C (cathepsin A)
MIRNASALLLIAALAGPVFGLGPAKPPKPEAPKTEPPKAAVSTTSHSITIGGKKIDYVAEAGTLTLKEEDGKPQANIFYVAYTKTQENPATRRLTFCFNGGPGSSSVWLHLGTFGPRRVVLSEHGEALAPAAKTVENEWSLLDLTDLVFIDPVSTGYSRAADEKNAKQFHGVQEDLNSVGEFIRLFTTRHHRWASPKFLAGESYGTTRAAGLSNHLQSRLGMRLNGIMLISAVLNFGTIRFEEGNDLPYSLFLPTYSAAAWYHKKLAPDLQSDLKKTLAEAEKFAESDYTLALTKGLKLTTEERRATAAKVARFTGVSQEYVLNSNLRLEGQRFMRQLLRDKGQIIGRYDSRLTARDGDDAAERPDFDPSYAAVQGPYTEGWNEYVRKDLKYESDLPYEILSGRVQPWNYGSATNRYLNVAPMLQTAMTTNKFLRVFVANGFYDLATPYAATQYTFNHLSPETSVRQRVTMTYYDAGHMMYINKPSLEKLKQDITQFMTAEP